MRLEVNDHKGIYQVMLYVPDGSFMEVYATTMGGVLKATDPWHIEEYKLNIKDDIIRPQLAALLNKHLGLEQRLDE